MKVEDIIDLKLQIKATADLVRTLNDIGSSTPAFRGIGVKYNQAKELYILDVQEIQEWYASLRFKEIQYKIDDIEKEKQEKIIQEINACLDIDWLPHAVVINEQNQSTDKGIDAIVTILTCLDDDYIIDTLEDGMVEDLNIAKKIKIAITTREEVI